MCNPYYKSSFILSFHITKCQTKRRVNRKIQYFVTLSPIFYNGNIGRRLIGHRYIHILTNKEEYRKPSTTKKSSDLELHIVRTIALAKGKSGMQILLHQGYILHTLQKLSIHRFLGRLSLFLTVFSLEVGISNNRRNLDGTNVNLGASGNHVGLVYTAQGNIVHALRTWRIKEIGQNKPDTRRSPEASCFKNTTRLPVKRPAKMIRTVPGVMEARSFIGLGSTAAGALTGKKTGTAFDILISTTNIRTVHYILPILRKGTR